MKTTISLLLFLLPVSALLAQEVDITGSWTMYEMSWDVGGEINTTTEAQLKDDGMMSEYTFEPDGKLTLVSNMISSNHGVLETVEGSWKLEAEKLTCTFNFNGNEADIVWDFEFKDDCIHLKRGAPDGSSSVVNSFKRK